MPKKNIVLVLVLVALAGFLLYLHRGWFVTEKVQIVHRAGPALRFPQFARQDTTLVRPVFFEFDRKLKLMSVKVVPVSETDTNRSLYPIWELKNGSGPVATKGFEYGADVPGMEPVLPGTAPDPLVPGKKYRLIIQAGRLRAEHEFLAEPPAR